VTEMAMTKEFLLAGKLHRAVTFGMDVPSVLFADAQGKETGLPTDDVQVGSIAQQAEAAAARPDSSSSRDAAAAASSAALDEKVLRQRLDVMVGECELDYHRVLAHRMVRALLPRHDFNCQILSTLMVEILAGCVLTPLLQTVSSPEYINSWIIMGLSAKKEQEGEGDDVSDGSGANVAARAADQAAAQSAGDASNLSSRSKGKEPVPPSDGDYAMKVLDEDAETTDAGMSTPANASAGAAQGGDREVEDAPPEPTNPTLLSPTSKADSILTVLGLALIELQRHVDLDEPGRSQGIDWDSNSCREAVLKLVLVIEAAMMDGRCTYSREDATDSEGTGDDVEATGGDSGDEGLVEVTIPEYESTTLSQILMEMTSDIDAFEERVARENVVAVTKKRERFHESTAVTYTPTSTEQSTLRTLIAAWLHTGQVYRVITVLVQAHTTVLSPYYSMDAFLRVPSNASGFVRKLRALDGIEILVDTMAVLAAPRLHETSGEELAALVHKSTMHVSSPTSAPQTPTSRDETTQLASYAHFGMSSSSNPRFLDFNRNEAFASSLRSERERRMHSWAAITRDADPEGSPLHVVCRTRGVTAEDVAVHKDLHHLARIFYGSTNLVSIRDAAKRRAQEGGAGGSISEASDVVDSIPVNLITVETASQRRRIEIPDDDSSFLLRAQVS
jgi:PXA domain